MQRRQLLAAGGMAGLTLAAPGIARANTGITRFSVWREGSNIGSHILRFTQTASETVVDIDIDLVVKLLFIPVYDYSHVNQERWLDGRLAGFASETDDNGDPFKVIAKSTGEMIVTETLEGQFEHPLTRRPTTYWHKNFLTQTDWIDTQKGSTINCQIETADRRVLDVLGRKVETEHFELSGDLKLNLWYLDDHWVKLTFKGEDGSIIEYRLEQLEPIEMSFA